MASLVAQIIKHLPIMWETWVQSLGQEDPQEKEMATHSRFLARTTEWTVDYNQWGHKESDATEHAGT